MEQSFHAISALTLVDQIKEQIQRAITSGKLLPNQRLSESEIASRLGVSRGPVREAARLLEQSGLLVSLPRRGFFVRQFAAKDIEDIYELRAWIEAASVEIITRRGRSEDYDLLSADHSNIVKRARSGQNAELIEAIIEFHRSICALSGNDRVLRLFDEIAVEIRPILSILGVGFDKSGYPAEARVPLLEAIKNGNNTHAVDEIRHLISLAKSEIMVSYRSYIMQRNG